MKSGRFSGRFKCAVCGKETAGRLPGIGRDRGDGSFWYPRRHKVNGKDCPGNIQEAIIMPNSTPNPEPSVASKAQSTDEP